MPKISVILPVYNVEQYIAKSIHSVLNQSYIDFELIVVIDGSKDNSEVIAREFEKTDLRVKVYTKPNGGLSDARNYGLNMATGEFIYFLDSDDWIENNLLKENIEIMVDKQLDFLVFGFYQDSVDNSTNTYNSYNLSQFKEALKAVEKEVGELDLHQIEKETIRKSLENIEAELKKPIPNKDLLSACVSFLPTAISTSESVLNLAQMLGVS